MGAVAAHGDGEGATIRTSPPLWLSPSTFSHTSKTCFDSYSIFTTLQFLCCSNTQCWTGHQHLMTRRPATINKAEKKLCGAAKLQSGLQSCNTKIVVGYEVGMSFFHSARLNDELYIVYSNPFSSMKHLASGWSVAA